MAKPAARSAPMPSLAERLPPDPPYDPRDGRAAARAFAEKMRSLSALDLPPSAGWLE